MGDLKAYSPNAPGKKGSLFGLPHDRENAKLIIVPVPWDVTSSYGCGAASGPEAILNASPQLDLEVFGKEVAPWKHGIYMDPVPSKILNASKDLREIVEPYIRALEDGAKISDYQEVVDKVNMTSLSLNAVIMKTTSELIEAGKMVGLLGGDHSAPYGFLEALSAKYSDFGILQIDAHMDLRISYEGFVHSHASIMYNAHQLPSVSKIVQVGVRDFCEEEKAFVEQSDKLVTFFDYEIRENGFHGKHWHSTVLDIVSRLPHFVYISFDIDGLNPNLCSGTGTPVPGGLEYNEAVHLINQIVKSGRQIIGFDLCEVSPKKEDNEWNANVGARLLYQLCGVILDL